MHCIVKGLPGKNIVQYKRNYCWDLIKFTVGDVTVNNVKNKTFEIKMKKKVAFNMYYSDRDCVSMKMDIPLDDHLLAPCLLCIK